MHVHMPMHMCMHMHMHMHVHLCRMTSSSARRSTRSLLSPRTERVRALCGWLSRTHTVITTSRSSTCPTWTRRHALVYAYVHAYAHVRVYAYGSSSCPTWTRRHVPAAPTAPTCIRTCASSQATSYGIADSYNQQNRNKSQTSVADAPWAE